MLEYHLPALKALRWLEEVVVVEPLERNVAAIRERFPSVTIKSVSYQEALADQELLEACDGVLVALPNTLHPDATLRSLTAGLPVLCEKPLALSAEECRTLGTAAAKHERLVAVGMVRRFMPNLTALRESLRAGLAGEITSITLEHGGDCRYWPWDTETVLRRDQGGCLINMGIHFLDYLEWTFGRLEPVAYDDDFAGGIEVNCDLRMRTATNVPVRVRISWTNNLKNELRVEGTTGTLIMGLDEFSCARWRPQDGAVEAMLTAERPYESGDWQPTFDTCFVEQIWQFAAAVRGRSDTSRLVQGHDVAHCHEIIEWAYKHRVAKAVVATSNRPCLEPAAVAVTGGTGFVGSYLVERLAELGMTSITVPVRQFRSGGQIARFPMAMKRTNLLDEASCREAFRGARYVFHLAYGTAGDKAGEFTVQSTRTVLRAALAEGVESVVIFGTCTIWAGYEEMEVDEATPLKPALGDYGNSKATMQADCLAFARKHPQMRVSVVAPGAVYGPRGGLFCVAPCEAAKQGTFAWFEGGRGICNYVHVANLVDLAILAAVRPEATGECFIGVDGATDWRQFLGPLVEPWSAGIPNLSRAEMSAVCHQPEQRTSLKEVAREVLASPEIMSAISRHKILGSLKDWFTKLFPARHRQLQRLRAASEKIQKPPRPAPGVSPWMADIYGPGTVRFSRRKASEVLGWQPEISLEQGMVGCVAWLKETGLHD